jgi:hypothetical protein
MRGKLITPELVEQMKELRATGFNNKDIAVIIGTSAGTISKHLIAHGYYGSQRVLKDGDKDAIVSAYDSGISQKELAEKYGVTQSRISDILRTAGWHYKEWLPTQKARRPEGIMPCLQRMQVCFHGAQCQNGRQCAAAKNGG